MRRHADPVRSCSEALMAPLLLPVIYLTFISLMALALLAASAFPPNALRRLRAACDWKPRSIGNRTRLGTVRAWKLCTIGAYERFAARRLLRATKTAAQGMYKNGAYERIVHKLQAWGLRTFSCTSYTGRRRDARYSSGVIHPSPCEILPERNHRIQESRAPMNSPRAAPLQSRA